MDGVRILTDPVLRNRVGHIRRHGNAVNPLNTEQVDAVLISHMHLDHLDIPSLRLLGYDVRLIVPRGSAGLLRRQGFTHVEELRAGDLADIGALSVVATVAHHEGARYPFGPEADCLGFLVQGDSNVYFAGDTDLFPEMATLAASRLDLALLPVWGWGPRLGEGHLTPRRAAESLQLLHPRAAIPIHWGTFAPMGLGWMRPRFLTAPPRDFAVHASRLAPDVDVRVVAPGNLVQLPA